MKKTIIAAFLLLFLCIGKSFAQYTTTKTDGGSAVTKYNDDYSVNKGSTLKREWYTLNNAACPLQLKDIGISTLYDSKYLFTPKGEMIAKDTITAYEIHHILYDVFGRFLVSLRNFTCKNIAGNFNFPDYWSWGSDMDMASEYYTCVSYVACVRTSSGKVWKYNPIDIKAELNKIQIVYEDSYSPKSETKK